jgi:hypothetical protein
MITKKKSDRSVWVVWSVVNPLLRSVLVLLFCLGIAPLVPAADFGLILDETLEAEGSDQSEGNLAWTQTAIPWFSYAPNLQFEFYLSLGFGLERTDITNNTTLEEAEKWRPLFQVNRSQLTWKPQSALMVEAGRVAYEDPLGRIASGFFDGAKASLNLGQNTLNIAALYSGLQFKERAKIVMTEGDMADYFDEDTYFASKRLLLSFFWQSRYPWNRNITVDLGGLAQFDLRDDEAEKLHSQYAVGKISSFVFSALDIAAGGIFGVKEQGSGSALSFAGDLSAAFAFPGALNDRLSLSGYVSSGSEGRELRPYFPITAIAAGKVYTPSLTGLYTAELAYQLKPFDGLYLSAEGRYFWRTSRNIIPGTAELNNSDKDNLGAEVWAAAVWMPLSDLSFTLQGGVFFPNGPVKDAGTPLLWKATIGATLSL